MKLRHSFVASALAVATLATPAMAANESVPFTLYTCRDFQTIRTEYQRIGVTWYISGMFRGLVTAHLADLTPLDGQQLGSTIARLSADSITAMVNTECYEDPKQKLDTAIIGVFLNIVSR